VASAAVTTGRTANTAVEYNSRTTHTSNPTRQNTDSAAATLSGDGSSKSSITAKTARRNTSAPTAWRVGTSAHPHAARVDEHTHTHTTLRNGASRDGGSTPAADSFSSYTWSVTLIRNDGRTAEKCKPARKVGQDSR